VLPLPGYFGLLIKTTNNITIDKKTKEYTPARLEYIEDNSA
jgi:hypothetical protein